uniref:Uncharacterized protein n=1 Tax=Ignisphaera aggregans TaxID=334771 RepID=A0A7J3Z5Q0_9CREN
MSSIDFAKQGSIVSVTCTTGIALDLCKFIERNVNEIAKMFPDLGLKLKNVTIVVRKCGEDVVLQFSSDLAQIDGIGVFRVDSDEGFWFVNMLSEVVASYIFTHDLLPSCPRWVIEGLSLYIALEMYRFLDPAKTLSIERLYASEASRCDISVDLLKSWSLKDHPSLQIVGKLLSEKVAKLMQVFYTEESEKGKCVDTALSLRSKAFELVKKALSSLGTPGVGDVIKLLSQFGNACEEKVLSLDSENF